MPTAFRVDSGGMTCRANCASDTFCIAALPGRDTPAQTRRTLTNERLDLSVVEGKPAAARGVVHLPVPPGRFRDNVPFT